MTVAIGRAELVLLVERLGLSAAEAAATLLGYERKPEQPKERKKVSDKAPATVALPQQPGIERDEAAVPFLRLEAMEFFEPIEAQKPKGEGLSSQDITSPGVSLFAYPKTPPLAPWSKLWPVIRSLIQRRCESRAPDIPAVVRSIGRGVVPRHLPRVTRSTWPASLSVWLDRSERLTPVWDDQLDVLERLSKVCGPSAVKLRVLDARESSGCLRRHGDLSDGKRWDGQTTVLVLGDLGCFGSALEREAWQKTTRRLAASGAPFAALVPAARGRWTDSVARHWKAAPWEQRRLAPVDAGSHGATRDGVNALLRLLSMAALVQPGLLRTIRRLLPASVADIATELEVWQSNATVEDPDSTGLMVRPDVAEGLREALREDVLDGKIGPLRELRDAIQRWHQPLPPELLHADALLWKGTVPVEVAAPPGIWDATCEYLQKVANSVQRGEHLAPLAGFGQATLPGLPERIYSDDGVRKGLVALLAVSSDRLPDLEIPAGVEPYEIAALLGEMGQEQWWAVRQVGKNLVFRRSTSRWPSEDAGPGSPVAWLLAASRDVWVGPAQDDRRPVHLQEGLTIPWNGADDLWIVTDRSKVHLAVCQREEWMLALGRDRYGVYADADIQGVVQRFRWIPPGRCWIGPPTGPGGGRRQVDVVGFTATRTRGRWVGESCVTRALWEVVMGENTNRPDLVDCPVERVTWAQAQAFCERAGDIEWHLPGGIEWQYAFRGGVNDTTTGGQLDVSASAEGASVGANTAENGSRSHELVAQHGIDLGKRVPEEEQERSRRGPGSMANQERNAFGLFGMSDRVSEWCADHAEMNLRSGRWVSLAVGTREGNGAWYDPFAGGVVPLRFRLARNRPASPMSGNTVGGRAPGLLAPRHVNELLPYPAEHAPKSPKVRKKRGPRR